MSHYCLNKLAKLLCFFVISLFLRAQPCYGMGFGAVNMSFDTYNFLEVIDNHILSLREKKIAEAYAYTSRDFKKENPYNQFESFIKKAAPLSDNYAINLGSISFIEQAGIYRGLLTANSGEQAVIEYVLIKERGGWKIQGFNLFNNCDQNQKEGIKKQGKRLS